uniref:Uncharacterized protein n=1 Tax=Magallana gigas TaxID=29159 RepID=K1QI95_MAGGI
MLGRNVQNLVVVETGIDQDQFGAMILQNVKASNHVLPVIWVLSMIMLAMQFAITVHIQVECVVVQQDGMDDVAAACLKKSGEESSEPSVEEAQKKFEKPSESGNEKPDMLNHPNIQPPVMSGCHSNKEKWTSELMTHLNWTAPSFYDPLTLVNPCRYLKMEPWYAMDGVKTTDSFVWFSAAPSTV